MDILFLLIPMSVVLVLGILGVFAWALQSGQFDDLDRQADELLGFDGTALDADQHIRNRVVEESFPSHSMPKTEILDDVQHARPDRDPVAGLHR